MEKAFTKAVDQFQKDLTSAIKKVWPTLVASELMKLQTEMLPANRVMPGPKPKLEPKPEPVVAARVDPSLITDEMIADAIDKHGSKAAAARALKIAESTLRGRLKKAAA